MERIICLAGADPLITEGYLSEIIRREGSGPARRAAEGSNLAQAVERLERQMIVDALQQTIGNRSRAARLLGLTRQGLLNKLSRYGIAAPRSCRSDPAATNRAG
jgi:DNA-binding NtrC family response regulator